MYSQRPREAPFKSQPSFLLLSLPCSLCHCACVCRGQILVLALLAFLQSHRNQLPTLYNKIPHLLTCHFANFKSISPLRSACRRGCSLRDRRTTRAAYRISKISPTPTSKSYQTRASKARSLRCSSIKECGGIIRSVAKREAHTTARYRLYLQSVSISKRTTVWSSIR